MALTSKEIYDLNNSMTAAQNISLGDIISNLGSMANQSASSVNITGGTITGVSASGTFSGSFIGNAVVTGGSIVAQNARFGNSEGSTYFESDGTIVLSGSATVYKDLFFPLLSAKQGQTDKPAFDAAEQGYLFPSADTTAIMYITAQFNHDWKIGSTIYPHVHWNQNHSGSPVFKIDYKWFDIGGQVPASYTTYSMPLREASYTSGSMQQLNYGSTGISGSHITGVSSLMLIKLYRDDNAYSGNAIAYQFDIHTEIDGLGSRTEYSK